jgi:hypothetical protein
MQSLKLADVFVEGFALLKARCVLTAQLLALFVEPHGCNYGADTSPSECFFRPRAI